MVLWGNHQKELSLGRPASHRTVGPTEKLHRGCWCSGNAAGTEPHPDLLRESDLHREAWLDWLRPRKSTVGVSPGSFPLMGFGNISRVCFRAALAQIMVSTLLHSWQVREHDCRILQVGTRNSNSGNTGRISAETRPTFIMLYRMIIQ